MTDVFHLSESRAIVLRASNIFYPLKCFELQNEDCGPLFSSPCWLLLVYEDQILMLTS